MPRGGMVQEFCWVSDDTATGFVKMLNHAGEAGFELYSTYKVVDRFMGALMIRWVDKGEMVRSEPIPPMPAQVLRLVPSPEPDQDGNLNDGKPREQAD